MAHALYVHVPFCPGRCAYCGFYSGEPLERLADFPALVAAEAGLRGFPSPGPLTSVYLGGGTPSLLGPNGVAQVLEAARGAWGVTQAAEVTVETNPAAGAELRALRGVGVTRLSVGVQALDDHVLAALGRPHGAAQARRTLEEAARAGFAGVSADLLYGLPGLPPQALGAWARELAGRGVCHVSAYSLELHPGTPLGEAVAAGRARPCGVDEEEAQWEALLEALTAQGFEAYEVSNFARPGARSRHNQAYWDGSPYVGLGPGAHGYDPDAGPWGTRWWNAPGLAAYGERLTAGELPPGGREELGREEALLEVLFLAFRRTAPLEPRDLAARFGLSATRWTRALADLETQGLLARGEGASWTPTACALRRADGLALWARELLLAPEDACSTSPTPA
ncbi:MAG: coproporphyrinogen-III oxidase family protein [Thermodesulfobacteriota bacterium]